MPPRSYLYVPGHRQDRFAKALDSGADAVILDLEDAVPVHAKDSARADVSAFVSALPSTRTEVWVRINTGQRGVDDLRALRACEALRGVVVPKATPTVLELIHALDPAVALVPLIESALAVIQSFDMAKHTGVNALAIGEVDLSADIGLVPGPGDHGLWPLRMSVVLASSAAGLVAPLGPVSIDIEDSESFRNTTQQLRAVGFGARQAIHPKQVAIINEVFTPSAEELTAAHRLLELADLAQGGVCLDDNGRMIDEAVLRSARRLLGL